MADEKIVISFIRRPGNVLEYVILSDVYGKFKNRQKSSVGPSVAGPDHDRCV